MKKALIFGISGQMGSYCSERLLSEGYHVIGQKRRASSLNTQRIDHIFDNKNLELHYGDLSDQSSIDDLVIKFKPDLCFNFSAMSHVRVSFDTPIYTADITGTGAARVMESIRKYSPETHLLQASSSEMFGGVGNVRADEKTPHDPRSPYACAKSYSFNMIKNYREAYGLHFSNAICFNYESPRRGETFVSRKITRAATRIKLGLQSELVMGDISTRRDWSHCLDTLDGMMKIIQNKKADDYVISSDVNYSIEDFLSKSFSRLDLDFRDYLKFDDKYKRPTEVQNLLGNSSKIRTELGWSPKYNFDQLVEEMIDSDLELAKQELLIKNHKSGIIL